MYVDDVRSTTANNVERRLANMRDVHFVMLLMNRLVEAVIAHLVMTPSVMDVHLNAINVKTILGLIVLHLAY